MKNVPPPDSEKSELGLDEWIGIIVAFTAISAILIGILGQRYKLFNLQRWAAAPTSEQTTPLLEGERETTASPVATPQPNPTASAPVETASPSTTAPNSPPLPNQKPHRPSNSKTIPLATVPLVVTSQLPKETPSPSPSPSPSPNQTPTPTVKFTDVADNFWARPYIEALVSREIMNGFPDGTFKPNRSINRAEFAALLQKAFDQKPTLEVPKFKDISTDFWGLLAIQQTTKTGFLRGYPNQTFQPNQTIPKVQVLVAIASGLNLKAKTNKPPQDSLAIYQDASEIPNYATQKVGAATEAGIVVNYPNPKVLNPNKELTRAEVAALVYQALVEAGKAEAIPSNYVVNP